jgi:hypothetical protein
MAVGAARLSLLTFAQSWDGASLVVRFLALPKGDPEAAPVAGAPSFANANLIYSARLIDSLDHLPLTVDSVEVGPLVLDDPPTRKAAVFRTLAEQFVIVPPGAPRPKPVFRKSLTGSYQAIIGNRSRSRYLSDSEEYACALHEAVAAPAPAPAPVPNTVTWGRVIAFALRQPKLAAELGLIGQATVTPPDPQVFTKGGWLFIDLHSTSDYFGVANLVAKYASRIPPLPEARPLFSAVIFPVADDGPTPVADDAYREAELYDRGQARLVHGSQSDEGDSIRLAWDDEQIAEWFNRQVDRDGAGNLPSDAPLGVAGYRVDVRPAGDADWRSLVRVESRGNLVLAPHDLGPWAGESMVELVPAEISPTRPGEFWLPSYFAEWRGSSLVLADEDYRRLHEHPALQNGDAQPYLLNRDRVLAPVDDKLVALLYGQTYEFRVRLADLTRGGPGAAEADRGSIATIPFRRRKRPAQVRILERPTQAARQIRLAKPRLGFPEILFTGAAVFADLEADLAAIAADPDAKKARELGLPDPDVLLVEIVVEVRALDGDRNTFLPLYTTTREFAADEITVALAFADHPILASFPAQPLDGPLALPTARGLRLTLTALGREDPGYFATPADRRGVSITLECQSPAAEEDDLLRPPLSSPALRSLFFQSPEPASGLAQEAGLDASGLLLSGRAGHRTVIGCSSGLRSVLSPDRSSIQFASGADLIRRWVNILQCRLMRDWTWDGMDEAGIAVTRTIRRPRKADVTELVGTLRLPHVLAPNALTGVDPNVRAEARQWTDLLFFDAFDPKPAPDEHPAELTVEYSFAVALKGPPAPEVPPLTILLPIVTPPCQVPRLVSAGIALSPFRAADDYSSTEPRRRTLWFEFAEPPADEEDAYFVRVLANAPDPMLISERVPDVVEPARALDPEWMRLITPGQPRDDAGLRAMQAPPESPDSKRHYAIPLPEELNETSPELFGFFVYEVCLGHTASRWSTAQGRFGPPLRIAGVQHPAPVLICEAARGQTNILVRAPYASPVHQGRNMRPFTPATELWAILYARVRQVDAQAWRNIPLTRRKLAPPRTGNDLIDFGARVLYGEALFPLDQVRDRLREFALPEETPLTVLAAELFTNPAEEDPFGADLGNARTLRVSPLAPVPDAC